MYIDCESFTHESNWAVQTSQTLRKINSSVTFVDFYSFTTVIID